MIDPTVLQILTNGGFAALFVWLLVTTRTESAKREEESRRREDRLMETLEKYSGNLPAIAETLRKIEQRIERIEENRK